MARSKQQLADDRDSLVAALEQLGGKARTDTLICAAWGLASTENWWPYYTQAYADLRALERAGRVARLASNGVTPTVWSLPDPDTLTELDKDSDLRDIVRRQLAWIPDDDVD